MGFIPYQYGNDARPLLVVTSFLWGGTQEKLKAPSNESWFAWAIYLLRFIDILVGLKDEIDINLFCAG